jgi:hypothetical protein
MIALDTFCVTGASELSLPAKVLAAPSMSSAE